LSAWALGDLHCEDNSLDDDRNNPKQPILDGLDIGLVANDFFDTTNRSNWTPMTDARGTRFHVPTEVSATDEELLALRQSVQSVFYDELEGWVTDDDNTGAQSCSGPGHITNPRRPTGPAVLGECQKRSRAAARRARSRTPVQRRQGAAAPEPPMAIRHKRHKVLRHVAWALH
jgi:hypothetical protein